MNYAEYQKKANLAIQNAKFEPFFYLQTLLSLEAELQQDQTSPLDQAYQSMLKNNPFGIDRVVSATLDQINQQFIYNNEYEEGMKYLQALKELSETAGSDHSQEYDQVISVLMTCYHQQGDNQAAYTLFQNAAKHINHDNIRSMDLCNKFSEFFVNTLAFHEGISFLKAALQRYLPDANPAEEIGGVPLPEAEDTLEGKMVRARTVSSLGRLYSFISETDLAEDYFEKAILLFESIGSDSNANITLSHYAQLLLDQPGSMNQEKTIRILNEYFGTHSWLNLNPIQDVGTWKIWLQDILRNHSGSGAGAALRARFHILVYLKALSSVINLFDLNQKKEILHLVSSAEIFTVLQDDEIPAELLLKHHALIMLALDQLDIVNDDLNKLKAIRDKHSRGIIPMICDQGIYQISLALRANCLLPEGNQIEEDLLSTSILHIDQLYFDYHYAIDSIDDRNLIERLHSAQELQVTDLLRAFNYEHH